MNDAPTRSTRFSGTAQLVVATAGALITAAIAWAFGLPRADALALLAMAGGGAAVAGAIGAWLLASMRAGSLRAQAVAVALVAVAGTAIGVVLAASAMFVSTHDLGALFVVLAASSTVAVVAAIRFGNRISTASHDLEELARRIGDGDLLMVGDVPAAQEMRRLAEELRAASERLDDARRRERAMERARRELIAWVSHDLRTPLAGIRAMVEALEDGIVSTPDDVRGYHHTIRTETDRLALLVDDLFELSRIEAGTLDLTLVPTAVAEVVEEAVAGAAPLAASKGIHLSRGPGAVDATVAASPGELVRVLRNLLDNAIRHTPPGERVIVACEHDLDAAAVRVQVTDACGGIPAADLDRVFDLAFRGDHARTTGAGQGGGLGLAIARGLVHAHDGSIAVHNAGAGCAFTVTLPVSGRIGGPVTQR